MGVGSNVPRCKGDSMGSSDEFLSRLCTSLNLGTLHQFGLPGMSRVFRWGEIGDMAKGAFLEWQQERRSRSHASQGTWDSPVYQIPTQKSTQIPRCVLLQLPAFGSNCLLASELLQKDLRALYMKGKGSRKGQGISKLQMLMCTWQLKLQVDNCNGLTHLVPTEQGNR